MNIDPNVQKQLQAEQISEEEIQRMVRLSAQNSDGDCNRRYFDWLFKIEKNTLLVMRRATMMEIGKGPDSVYEEHDACDGKGCKSCGWIGEVIRHLKAPPEDRILRRT